MIPQELVDFFQNTKAGSILVKGAPGCGKTIFALSLLREVANNKNGIFVTTRINRRHLVSHFPGLEEVVPYSNIFEATSTKFPDQKKDDFSDSIDDEVIGMDYVTMSEFLLSILDKVGSVKDPIVVIDSWDAVISKLDENRSESEHDLIDFASKTDIRLVLIAEYEDVRELDYFVDGIISMRMDSSGARTMREINISKLRGVSIRQPNYLFTLEDGWFKSFVPYRIHTPGNLCPAESIDDPDNEHISTGIPDFDNVLGRGYRRGSFNLFELQHGVEVRDVLLIAPTILNMVRQGRNVFIFSTESIEEQVIENILSCLSEEELENYVMIQAELFDEEMDVPSYVFPAKGMDLMEDMSPLLKLRGDRMDQQTTLSILGFDRLEHIYGVDEVKKMIWPYLKYSQRHGQVDIGIVNESQKEIKKILGPMSYTHWKVKLKHNTALLYGIVPYTGYYVIGQDMSKQNCLNTELTPIR